MYFHTWFFKSIFTAYRADSRVQNGRVRGKNAFMYIWVDVSVYTF
jgi:hypothetical protein